jgi:hypothetical protein
MSKQKILISGCGLSWSGQECKVWTNILKIAGADIVDVGGPAVSNQWILDQAFITLLDDQTITDVVIQLTNLGKLDVEINLNRQLDLVESDSIRNFIYKGIWPSSASQEHPSKKLWYEFLYSPNLEQQELFCKLILLDHWCNTHDIKLTVVQGYHIPWSDDQKKIIAGILYDINYVIWNAYEQSTSYITDDYNSVPGLEFQFELALKLAGIIAPNCIDKIRHIQSQFRSV